MVKQLLTKAPILVPPTDVGPLLLYITATTQVVRTALVVEREEGHTLIGRRSVPQGISTAARDETEGPQCGFCSVSMSR